MDFRCLVKDMKNDLGSISSKGFDLKFGCRLRSRCHRVVQDGSVVVVDALKQSCWANMPHELLMDVLLRIEASESTWPLRRNVVACAGVCRSWRAILKDVVRSLEASGKLTFPVSLKQPGPKDSLLQCYIKRNRSSQTYYLFLSLNQSSNEGGKFLLAARRCKRPTCTDYLIFLNSDTSKGQSPHIGKLRSNFLGTKFTVYDASLQREAKVARCNSLNVPNGRKLPVGISTRNKPVAYITYELNVLGSRGPRRMQCIVDTMPVSAFEPQDAHTSHVGPRGVNSGTLWSNISFNRSDTGPCSISHSGTLNGSKKGLLVLQNKMPRWHEHLQCWCLNFNGRVTVASVKNFQLVATPAEGDQESEEVILQFGKVGKDVFTMDYQYPISAFQAFAICLSSFDTKIACE